MTTTATLRARESSLECSDATGKLHWSLPVASIILVAEYTTNEGPYVDDYFLIFVTAEERKLCFSTCSAYAAGMEGALHVLQQRLGSGLSLRLQSSTEWRSRVARPVKMAENEYFTFTQVPAKTLTEKFKKKLLGTTQEYALSEVVREYLEEQLTGRI